MDKILAEAVITTKAGWQITAQLVEYAKPKGSLTHTCRTEGGQSQCRSEAACRKHFESTQKHWAKQNRPRPHYFRKWWEVGGSMGNLPCNGMGA